MDIKQLINKILKKKGEVRSVDITKATGFSRAYINRFFKELQNEGHLVLIGKSNRARYISASKKAFEEFKLHELGYNRILQNQNISEDTVLDEVKQKTGIFSKLPKNVSIIMHYAFTEMLNNAIEHSRSEKIIVKIKRDKKVILFTIADQGVGIFNNMIRERNLSNVMEAIQDLLKGKQTTAPHSHSGEGIFFTSKAVDHMIIKGSNKELIFDNQIEDVFIKDIKPVTGTIVECRVFCNSSKDLQKIFAQFSRESFDFSRTGITVKLYKNDSDYISRSQAKRILYGLEKFTTIVLDFKDVEFVGQGFADEVFRVWQGRHPGIKIEVKNTNENVQFMIQHVLNG
jgi:anti-sigma regulatory factor (Ser/Thr protein kinase)